MNIKVLDKNLTFKNLIANFTDFICERKMSGIGKFTLVINKSRLKVQFKKNDILYIRENSPYIVKEINLVKSVDLQDEKYTITGYELKGLTISRITIPPSGSAEDVYTSKSTEYIVKSLVDKNLIDATDTDRNVSFLSNLVNQDRGSTIDYRTRYKNLAEEIEQLLKVENMGYSVNVDGEFEIYELTDKTADQSINNRVIFSIEKYKNMRDIEITKNDGKNYGYTGGSGDGVARVIAEVGTETGIDRHEMFIDVRDVSDTTELTEQGNQRLAEVLPTTIIQGKIEQNNYKYITDYDIGDLVTFQDSEFDTLDMLITSAKEIYSGTVPVQVELVFNYGLKNLADILKINDKNINSEVTK